MEKIERRTSDLGKVERFYNYITVGSIRLQRMVPPDYSKKQAALIWSASLHSWEESVAFYSFTTQYFSSLLICLFTSYVLRHLLRKIMCDSLCIQNVWLLALILNSECYKLINTYTRHSRVEGRIFSAMYYVQKYTQMLVQSVYIVHSLIHTLHSRGECKFSTNWCICLRVVTVDDVSSPSPLDSIHLLP